MMILWPSYSFPPPWVISTRIIRHIFARGFLIRIARLLNVGLVPSTWWRHQMETFSALLALCAGNSSVTGEFPSQRPVVRSFDVFFICAWTNGWVFHRDAGDLRRYHGHNDITVMIKCQVCHIMWIGYFFWTLYPCLHWNTMSKCRGLMGMLIHLSRELTAQPM